MRKTGWLAIAVLILFCPGCTVMKHFDGSSEEERRLFSSSRQELLQEINTARSQYEKEKQVSAERENTIRRLNAEVSDLKTDLSQKKAQLQELQESVAKEDARARLQAETLRDTTKKQEEAATPVLSKSAAGGLRRENWERAGLEGKERSAPAIQLKVLSGNGKMAAAVQAAKRLSALGYRVGKIDLAPRTNFRGLTLYYADGYEEEAQLLRKKFGADMEVKPLTWASAFPLILVAAR